MRRPPPDPTRRRLPTDTAPSSWTTRRFVLQIGGVGFATLAGCGDDAAEDGNGPGSPGGSGAGASGSGGNQGGSGGEGASSLAPAITVTEVSATFVVVALDGGGTLDTLTPQFRLAGTEAWTDRAPIAVGSSSYTYTGLAPETDYELRLQAQAGETIEHSNVETAATTAVPAAKYTATHFVSPTGTAAWADATNPATPCSALTAFANAGPGNRVQFAPGDYTPPDANGFQPAISGTAADPVVYFAEYVAVYESSTASHARILNTSAPPGVTRNNIYLGAGAAAGEAAFLVFDGFSFFQPEVSPIHGTSHMIRIHDGCRDIKVLRCYFDQQMGAGGEPNAGDNWGCIWIQGSSRIEVSDCFFLDIPGDGNNNTLVTQYSSGHLVFKHCYAENFPSGLFVKGVAGYADLTPQRIHHNIFRHPRHTAFHANNVGQGAGSIGPYEYCDFYQNIIDATDPAASLGFYSSTSPVPEWPHKTRIVNNLVYGPQHGFPGEGGIWTVGGGGINADNTIMTDCWLRNNLFIVAQTPTSHLGAWGGIQDDEGWSRINADHNIWSANFEGRFFGQRTLAEWRAVSSREQSSALSDDPGFVNAGQQDYRLEEGALARDFGEDILDLQGAGTSAPINAGPYISPDQDDVIGIRPVEITNTEALDWAYPYA